MKDTQLPPEIEKRFDKQFSVVKYEQDGEKHEGFRTSKVPNSKDVKQFLATELHTLETKHRAEVEEIKKSSTSKEVWVKIGGHWFQSMKTIPQPPTTYTVPFEPLTDTPEQPESGGCVCDRCLRKKGKNFWSDKEKPTQEIEPLYAWDLGLGIDEETRQILDKINELIEAFNSIRKEGKC